MKHLTNLFVVVTLGAGALGSSCGGSDAQQAASESGGSAAKAGASGRGAGGSSAGRGGASGGKAGELGTGGTAGSGAGKPSDAGGQGGAAGKASAGGRGGAGARAGRGGQGGTSGAGAASFAGAGGESGSRQCIAASSGAWVYAPPPGYEHVIGGYGANLDADGIARRDAVVSLALFLPDTGDFTLGIEDDSNLQTCQRCLQAKLWNFDGADRQFFADQGDLDIAASSDPLNGVLHASITGARLVEVTVDSDTAESTPVPGGYCIDLADTNVDVDATSPGTGGEGGGAGAPSGGNEGGAAGGPELPTDCVEVGVSAWNELLDTNDATYYSVITPNIGTAKSDLLALFEYSNAVGSFALGHGIDSTFASCDRCLLADVPAAPSDRYFFAMGGTLDIASSSQPISGVLDATLTDVTLVELGYDHLPLAGGACLHLASTTISLP
jgi:hypothetical protein